MLNEILLGIPFLSASWSDEEGRWYLPGGWGTVPEEHWVQSALPFGLPNSHGICLWDKSRQVLPTVQSMPVHHKNYEDRPMLKNFASFGRGQVGDRIVGQQYWCSVLTPAPMLRVHLKKLRQCWNCTHPCMISYLESPLLLTRSPGVQKAPMCVLVIETQGCCDSICPKWKGLTSCSFSSWLFNQTL